MRDQMMFGLDGNPNAVADNTGAWAARRNLSNICFMGIKVVDGTKSWI